MRVVSCFNLCILTLCASNLSELEKENQKLQAQIKQIELNKKLQILQLQNQQLEKQQSQKQSYKSSPESKDDLRTWVFASIGGGIADIGNFDLGVWEIASENLVTRYIGSIIDSNILIPEDFKIPIASYISPVFNVQIGGITMWNRYFGLQYYYALDLIFYSANSGNQTIYKGSAWLRGESSAFKGIMADSTFNADAILNAYNSDKFGVGFLVGFGVGFDVVKMEGGVINLETDQRVFETYQFPSSLKTSLDLRTNLGVRLIFWENYALDMQCSIPFLDTRLNPSISLRNNVNFNIKFSYGKF